MRWWLLLTICAGCGRIGFEPSADALVASDALIASDALACAAFGPFSEPIRLAGPIQTPTDDWFPTPVADELEIYLYRLLGASFDIVHASRPTTSDEFSGATRVDELSGPSDDKAPTLSADSLVIVFARDEAGIYELFESRRDSVGIPFGTPAKILEIVTADGAIDPWLSPDGLRLMFSDGGRLVETVRPDRVSPWSPGIQHTELSVNTFNHSPTTSSDGLDIWFASDSGSWDIYTAHRPSHDSPFSTPVLVPVLSSARDDVGLRLSLDGRRMYFNHDAMYDGTGNADVWVSTRVCQ